MSGPLAALGDAFGGPGGDEVQALVVDRYLDDLLSAGDRRAVDAPADVALDPDLRYAARALRERLTRVHPSFRFEERVAARLSELAHRQSVRVAVGDGGAWPAPMAALELIPGLDPADLAALANGDPSRSGAPAGRVPRQLLVGGALTSAALSLAGAAFVAWRRGRSPLDPMTRAVRAVGARRGSA